MWAKAVWEGGASIREMQVAFTAAASVPEEQTGRLHGIGPAYATVQALRRIGWQPANAVTWKTRLGFLLDLRETCPQAIKRAVYPVVRQVLSELLAHSHG